MRHFNAMSGCVSDPRLAAFGGVAAPVPSASLRSSSARPSASASPLPVTLVTGFRSTPDGAASASGNVLRTRAVGVFPRILLHWRRSAVSALQLGIPRAPGRCRSRRASFTDKAPWSVPLSSTPAWLLQPGVRTARRLRRHRRTHDRPPRCARPLQRSPQERAALDCRRHAPVFGTPHHGPCRRGPASRLPCATRRRGPSPTFGPVRPSSFASHVRASPVTRLRFSPTPCPHHCGRLCPRFRQRASHVCPQRLHH